MEAIDPAECKILTTVLIYDVTLGQTQHVTIRVYPYIFSSNVIKTKPE